MDFIIMKKYNIHFSFIILLVASLMLGLFKNMVLILICFAIHELGHLFFIKIFKYRFSNFSLYPYGGVISYQEKNDFLFKEIFVTSGGVIANFIFYLLFLILGIDVFAKLNFYFIIINLIPIYPLDGGKLLLLFIAYFLPNKLARFIVYSFSIILVVLSIILFKFDGIFFYFTTIMIIKENILGLININKNYKKFTLLKYLNKNSNLKDKETRFWVNNPIDNLFIGKNMVFDYETFKVREEEVLNKYYKNKKD